MIKLSNIHPAEEFDDAAHAEAKRHLARLIVGVANIREKAAKNKNIQEDGIVLAISKYKQFTSTAITHLLGAKLKKMEYEEEKDDDAVRKPIFYLYLAEETKYVTPMNNPMKAQNFRIGQGTDYEDQRRRDVTPFIYCSKAEEEDKKNIQPPIYYCDLAGLRHLLYDYHHYGDLAASLAPFLVLKNIPKVKAILIFMPTSSSMKGDLEIFSGVPQAVLQYFSLATWKEIKDYVFMAFIKPWESSRTHFAKRVEKSLKNWYTFSCKKYELWKEKHDKIISALKKNKYKLTDKSSIKTVEMVRQYHTVKLFLSNFITENNKLDDKRILYIDYCTPTDERETKNKNKIEKEQERYARKTNIDKIRQSSGFLVNNNFLSPKVEDISINGDSEKKEALDSNTSPKTVTVSEKDITLLNRAILYIDYLKSLLQLEKVFSTKGKNEVLNQVKQLNFEEKSKKKESNKLDKKDFKKNKTTLTKAQEKVVSDIEQALTITNNACKWEELRPLLLEVEAESSKDENSSFWNPGYKNLDISKIQYQLQKSKNPFEFNLEEVEPSTFPGILLSGTDSKNKDEKSGEIQNFGDLWHIGKKLWKKHKNSMAVFAFGPVLIFLSYYLAKRRETPSTKNGVDTSNSTTGINGPNITNLVTTPVTNTDGPGPNNIETYNSTPKITAYRDIGKAEKSFNKTKKQSSSYPKSSFVIGLLFFFCAS